MVGNGFQAILVSSLAKEKEKTIGQSAVSGPLKGLIYLPLLLPKTKVPGATFQTSHIQASYPRRISISKPRTTRFQPVSQRAKTHKNCAECFMKISFAREEVDQQRVFYSCF